MPAGPVATAQPREWVKAGGDCDDAGRCGRNGRQVSELQSWWNKSRGPRSGLV